MNRNAHSHFVKYVDVRKYVCNFRCITCCWEIDSPRWVMFHEVYRKVFLREFQQQPPSWHYIRSLHWMFASSFVVSFSDAEIYTCRAKQQEQDDNCLPIVPHNLLERILKEIGLATRSFYVDDLRKGRKEWSDKHLWLAQNVRLHNRLEGFPLPALWVEDIWARASGDYNNASIFVLLSGLLRDILNDVMLRRIGSNENGLVCRCLEAIYLTKHLAWCKMTLFKEEM